MRILGIDTSTNSTSVCIIEDDKLICEYTVNTKKTHSQKLMVMIESMVKESDLNIKDIDAIAICIGPGSFTGLRISMATAKAIAQVRNLPIIAVNSLESLAFNMNLCDKIICPILDAQRNQVYTGKYIFENGEFKTIEDVKVVTIDELIDELSKTNKEFIIVGEATNLYKEKLDNLKNTYIASVSNNVSKASSLCAIAYMKFKKDIDVHNCYTINPMYIRKSQAEVQYEEKMKRIENGK
ncbi:tRNA (adenosine(37)-N6)-threonylcarbamoyltransferase complex dimerization subunit type 1 TsaB [Paraclostridium ghonii]|uniref:tRNA (adenosine(37)-N6)-threonylcarbamoyltransferase complex dimerization subunit type 1 TsaB n=1 Tax=Paraclostridium ghonii TaxID=29358 RepID=UPI00202CE140|nr:tRNA (adenosine(37)-N6)-threonylcarbamoyltransferase complex dimerization subunit type 1 TsaB [Paeniclostridium ghonii]MCM0164994.1 tRNA (adenosine(37)-N6)-threonylcarbamoyltransferase complex dimerization subunit type 1 TsaB [Paeniclostridium ghonii]